MGREAELGRIAAAMDRQASPGSTGVVLAGPAGVGKTRLAWEALRQARERGARVEWVAVTEAAATIPFGPVAHLLPPPARPPARCWTCCAGRRTASRSGPRAGRSSSASTTPTCSTLPPLPCCTTWP